MVRSVRPLTATCWFASMSLLLACGGDTTAPPSPAQIVIYAGDGQKAAVSTTVAVPPAVAVTDKGGNPVGNVPVTFTVISGGGSVAGARTTTTTTNASGVAAAVSWRLGPALGTNQLTATASGSGIVGNPVTFTATDTGCTDCWTTKASMPTARSGLAIEQVSGILYAIGGLWAGGELATVEAYDPSTDTWTTKASMPTAREGLGVAAIGGILYAVGGSNSTGLLSTVEAYDPRTDAWTRKAAMPTARYRLAVAAINGVLYAMGGEGSTGHVFALEAYDPSTNTWTTKASMLNNGPGLGGTMIDGSLYAVGGSQGPNGDVAAMEVYDPATDTWTMRASMSTARGGLGVTAVKGILYAVGGYSYSIGNVYDVATVEIYDPSTNSWAGKAPLPAPRGSLAATTIDGLVFAVGGGAPYGPIVAAVTAYQP